MAWIGVDLDGTLADYPPPPGVAIGFPIFAMVQRVREMIAEGNDVRIFTARAASSLPSEYRRKAAADIMDWCERHIGKRLPVTAEKDFGMIVLYDDRCIHVEPNTGRIIG